jgi:hypothetical protein
MKLLQLIESKFLSSKEEVEAFLKKNNIRNYTINDDLTVDVDGSVELSRKRLEMIPVKFGKVSVNFYCEYNALKSLEGAPKEVGGSFYCTHNKLTSLRGAPREVFGRFDCSDNQLTSLIGAPREVGLDFYCSGNDLTSLKGAPREVGRRFVCRNNPNLTSLDGIGNVEGEIRSDL